MENTLNSLFRAIAPALFFVSIVGLGISTSHADAVAAYLTPSFKVGEHLSDVFSKTVSIKGSGFREKVSRTGGSADYAVTGVTPNAIIFDEDSRYDGRPSSGVVHDVELLRDGITICYKGKCRIDDDTSGVTFNPLLWGNAPNDIRAGTSWTTTIPKHWEIGPAGTEQVHVIRVDPLNGVITLTRHGRGHGLSSDDQLSQKNGTQMQVTTAAGKKIEVSVIPGEAVWSGYTTIRRGVIVSDEVMVQRHVTLITTSGNKFEGEQRSYTLLNLSQDAI